MESLGCYFLHIYYPSQIYLEQPSRFAFEFENEHFSVLIIKTLKSLVINDFDNEILSKYVDEKPFHELKKKNIELGERSFVTVFDNGSIGYAINPEKNLYTEFYPKDYTEVIVSFESQRKDDNVSTVLKALSYFIESYRFVSGDLFTLDLSKTTSVSMVTRDYFHTYSDIELKMPKEERSIISREVLFGLRQVRFPFWNTQGKTLLVDKKKVSANLANHFKNRIPSDALADFLLRAREELHVHKNYKYAFIETWTALEIAIVNFLKNVKLKKGISKTKIEAYESEVGISYLLNIELPLIHQTNDDRFKMIIGKVDAIRKLRNKVIHENRDINFEQAQNAHEVAMEFFTLHGNFKCRKGELKISQLTVAHPKQ